jgi:hypothetical protein
MLASTLLVYWHELDQRLIPQMLAMMPMQDSHFTGNWEPFCLYYQLLRIAAGIHSMSLMVSSVNKMVHNGILKTQITTLDRLHHRDFLEKLKPRCLSLQNPMGILLRLQHPKVRTDSNAGNPAKQSKIH